MVTKFAWQFREQLGRGKTRRKGMQSKHCRQKGKRWGRLLGVGQRTGMTWIQCQCYIYPAHTGRPGQENGARCQAKRTCKVARSPWLVARRNI